MAKDDKGGKIRVLVFELEGSNETLQESLRTVANALGRTLPAPRLAPALGNGKSQATLVNDEEALEEAEDVTPAAPRRPRRRVHRAPSVVDMDLKSGDMPFETFCSHKNPSSDAARYAVIAVWLKQHRGIDVIGPDHIYTCYRIMKWSVPTDTSATFRAGKKLGRFSSTTKGLYSVNHVGENFVEKMSGGE